MKKILCLICAVSTALSVFASAPDKKDSTLEFNPHWTLTVQGGLSYTLHGNADFKDLLSPAAAIYAGYQFTPVVGLRFGASGWESKGAVVARTLPQGIVAANGHIYKHNYVQGNLDLTIDLASLFGGFRHNRVFNPYVFVGVGANGAFNNGEIAELAAMMDRNSEFYDVQHIWKDTKWFVVGRAGLGFDFNLCDHVLLGVEVNANMLKDKYNSRHYQDTFDWQFNGLVGLKFRLGKNYRKLPVAPVTPIEPAPEVPETTSTDLTTDNSGDLKQEETPEVPIVVPAPEFSNAIYFTIGSSKIKAAEQSKIDELAAFLNEHPETNVVLDGYADKGTGSTGINDTLSQARADSVAAALQKKGIAAERITTKGHGGVEDHKSNPAEDRVVITIAK